MDATEDTLAERTAAGLRRLADLFEQHPDLLASGFLSLTLHPGSDGMDAWAEALRAAEIPFTDRNDEHSRSISSESLAGFRAVSVHDEPYRRYLAEQEFVRAHREQIHGATA